MSETTANGLLVSLQRSNRRWKALAIGLLVVLSIVIMWAMGMVRREAFLTHELEMARQAAEQVAGHEKVFFGSTLRTPPGPVIVISE
jgi:hypothetical protein